MAERTVERIEWTLLDMDLSDWLDTVEEPVDRDASRSKLTDLVDQVILDQYPQAEVEVTWVYGVDSLLSWGDRPQVCFADDDYPDRDAGDILEYLGDIITDRAWQQGDAWLVMERQHG